MEKIYRVQMNAKGMPNFATAQEVADRPQGEWIKHEHGFWTFVNDRGERDGWFPDYECNLCGSRAWRYATNFCPNCGARMKGADDEMH